MRQMLTKNQIRALVKEERQRRSELEIDVASKKVYENIVTFIDFQKASILFLYAALPQEVQTKQLIIAAKAQGKEIAFPKINPISQEMDFYSVKGLEDLELCQYGKLKLLEPDPNKHSKVIPHKEDIMIVPGVAFDLEKHRIGYGGGYYDRYLEKHSVNTIGVCFDFQLFKEITVEAHDVVLQKVVTDSQIIV